MNILYEARPSQARIIEFTQGKRGDAHEFINNLVSNSGALPHLPWVSSTLYAQGIKGFTEGKRGNAYEFTRNPLLFRRCCLLTLGKLFNAHLNRNIIKPVRAPLPKSAPVQT